jgi:hypothetical protein
MIRLGRKYEISYLRDEGLARLKREFPTTLEEYDRLPEEYLSFTYPETQCGLDPIVDIIKLAHECNIQSMLPALYLQATSWKLVRPIQILAFLGRSEDQGNRMSSSTARTAPQFPFVPFATSSPAAMNS